MTRPTPTSFSWEGTENPNDPSGIAVLACDGITVRVPLNNFKTACRLSYLLEAAYSLGKRDAISRALQTIPELLNGQRYD